MTLFQGLQELFLEKGVLSRKLSSVQVPVERDFAIVSGVKVCRGPVSMT